MTLVEALKQVVEGESLSREQMQDAMRALMTGHGTPAQVAGFLIALRMKGETVEEIAGAAQIMRELATPVPIGDNYRANLVDTCGTGGDGSGLFNVSTACALVVAAAGGRVAKHGNRSVSSSSGSADVLEAAGVSLALKPEDVARCVEQVGVGFMFAPAFHSAMKHAIGPRKEMAVRTIFNLLGPLTNPAGACRQVIGVFDSRWLEPLAKVLQQLGSVHVMIVHSDDGLDEMSIAAPTRVAELRDGKIRSYSILPGDFGIRANDLEDVRAENAQQSLERIRQALSGQPGAARDIVCLNAGAALYVSGLADDLATGYRLAERTIDSGKASATLASLAELSQSLERAAS